MKSRNIFPTEGSHNQPKFYISRHHFSTSLILKSLINMLKRLWDFVLDKYIMKFLYILRRKKCNFIVFIFRNIYSPIVSFRIGIMVLILEISKWLTLIYMEREFFYSKTDNFPVFPCPKRIIQVETWPWICNFRLT